MTKKLNVAELFAGVGGFRVGFERADKNYFKTVYANQWEPSTIVQHAFDCYVDRFGETNEKQFHDNTDIVKVNDSLEKNKNYIPFDIDLLVGGFPCQDYSVATTKAKGLQGKKGVLWWEIERMLSIKKPSYLLLENVDRLLMSPKVQRGRDFLIMLAILNKHGYNVEWRVVNAAEYGFVQRRKRVFIFAQKWNSPIDKNVDLTQTNKTVLTKNLRIIKSEAFDDTEVANQEIQEVSNNGTFHFLNYGYMIKGKVHTVKVDPLYDGEYTKFEDILEENVGEEFYLNNEQKKRIFAMKDGGKRERITKDGFKYIYSEGKMSRHDNVEGRHARTMLTSEGTINRSTHIVKESGNRYRFITPIEAERLNGFEDNWTQSIPTKNKRYFTMGNALVTNVVEEIGKSIKYWNNKK